MIEEYREVVESFGKKMVGRLEANSDKGDRGDWKGESYEYLFARLREEVEELAGIIEQCKVCPHGKGRVSCEAADIANFAMMIADKVGGLCQDEAKKVLCVDIGYYQDRLAKLKKED